MSTFRNSAELFAFLILFWILLNGAVSLDVLVVGVAAALAIPLAFREGLSFLSEYRLTPRSLTATLGFIGYFLAEMVRSNIRLARIILSPALPIEPAIVKVRTRLKSPVGRLLLANAITLTPGTLTVDLDGEWLFVHWVSSESTDIEVATAEIVAGFERTLEVMYG